MRYLAALGALCFLASSSLAPAQIQVSAQMERSDYLLYERVDLLVTVANVGESDLILNNEEGHPWLSFLVTKHNGLPVHQERTSTFKPISLKAGENKTLRINITPLFSFREEGQYNASAVIDLPGEGQIVSDSIPFTVMRGRQVWTQTRPVNGADIVYSLIRFSPQPDRTKLYLRVEDPSENTVLANLALGDLVAYIDPEVFFDPQGNIHVMQPIAMSTYLYTRADAEGKILHQSVFKTYLEVPPRLTKLDDGSVVVQGGMEDNSDIIRESLSQGQKKPDSPAPPPMPGPSDSPDATNSPVTPPNPGP
jgi:hypothetical protein